MQIKLRKQLLVEDVYLYIELHGIHSGGWIKMFYQENLTTVDFFPIKMIIFLKIYNHIPQCLCRMILSPLKHGAPQIPNLLKQNLPLYSQGS